MTIKDTAVKMPIAEPLFKGPDEALRAMTRRSGAPAVLCDRNGQPLAHSESGAGLEAALLSQEPELRGLLLTAAASGGAITGRVTLGASEEEAQAYEISVLPLEPHHLFVSARDATFEHNLTRALLKSRDLYKDLMHCSADFGWETDSDGAFSYVSPSGALGWTPQDMNGRHAGLLLGLSPEDHRTVFATRAPLRMVRVKARNQSGETVLLSVSAVPVALPDGSWRGARGVARDITADHERDKALRLDQARQALLSRIVLDIRTEADPADIVRLAAESCAAALRAECASAIGLPEGDVITTGAPGLAAIAAEAVAAQKLDEADDVQVRLGLGDKNCLTASAGGHDALAAAMLFQRDVAREPWRAHELELLNGVAGHLAIALKQAHMIRKLERLSRTDGLTGLLNRRAFFEDVTIRMAHQRRSGRPGAFLFIDLDHFKDLNDRLGHAKGDAALSALGRELGAHLRAADIAGRLGGDEFALWLEDTSLEGARRKAEAIMELAGAMRMAAGDPEAKLSMSIGIAVSDPERWKTPEVVAEVADAALYAAKRKGRSQIIIAGEEGESRHDG